MTEAERSKLKNLVEETDLTLAEIASNMGWSYHTFRLRVAEAGLEIRRVLVSKSDKQTRLPVAA